LARQLRSGGSDVEETLVTLRRRGATIMDSIKVIRTVEAVPLGVAKDLVDSSIAWADQFDANDRLRQIAIEAIEGDPIGDGDHPDEP
jgi:hypothetical protein